MGNLTLTTKNNYGYTAISNIFISSFVPEANGEFVKVYLYLLHLISTGNSNISISLLADTFNQTEADIMRALRYWDKLNVISLTFAGNNDSLSNITINDFSSDNSAASTTKANTEKNIPIAVATKEMDAFLKLSLENVRNQVIYCFLVIIQLIAPLEM